MDHGDGNPAEEGVTLLSASSVQTFLRCQKQWFFANVMGIKRPPTFKQLLGTSGHEAVASNLRQKQDTLVDLPLEAVLDTFSDRWDKEAADATGKPDEKPGEFKDGGIKSVELYHTTIAPTIMPVWVEQPIQFEVNGIPYSGYVDLVDHLERVRDHKFTTRKPSGQQYMLNMTGYAIAYRHITGGIEADVQLDAIVRYKKGPEHRPVASGGPVTDHAIQTFASIVEIVSEQIRAGRFLPNGLVGNPPACSWCGYVDICPDYAASKAYEEPDTLLLALERSIARQSDGAREGAEGDPGDVVDIRSFLTGPARQAGGGDD